MPHNPNTQVTSNTVSQKHLRIPSFLSILGLALLLCPPQGGMKGGCQVGIGTNSPDASSILEMTSTSQGVLVPKMTTIQRDAIASPANGLMVFVTTDSSFYYNAGSLATPNWTRVTGAGSDGWTDDGTTVRLTTASDSVGIGTPNPSKKLHLTGGNLLINPVASDEFAIDVTATDNVTSKLWTTAGSKFAKLSIKNGDSNPWDLVCLYLRYLKPLLV